MKDQKTSSNPEGEKPFDAQVEQLLLSKSFEELSVAEQKLIEPHLSADKYSFFRQILLSTKEQKQTFSGLPDPAVQDHVLRQFRLAKQRPGIWDKMRQVLQYPIPSWQVGLACLALCFATYFLSSTSNSVKAVNDSTQESDAKVILTSRSAEQERELLVLLTGVR